MLAVSSLLLATLVSLAVIGWMPRPAPPQMRLDRAVEVLRGARAPGPEGMRVTLRETPPGGHASPWLTQLVAQQLGQPVEHVRLVWKGADKAPDIKVFARGASVSASADPEVVRTQGALLAALQWPAFELGVRRADGRWQVLGSDVSDVAAWRRQVLLALLGGTLLLAPLATWAALRIGRPLRRLADASAAVTLHATTRLPDDGPREVQVLASAINAGRERLRDQAQDMTRMLAAVAHDLRTPLTGLRLRAESAPPAQAARMVADIERMNAMIEQVLDYARGELEPASMQPVEMGALLDDCVQSARLRGVQIQADLPAHLPWHGDALLLRRALDNLIDNAARYAGAVELSVQRTAEAVCVDVADRGPGIPEAERARVLQPFQRHETSRNRSTGGTGLGLAVVQGAVRQHGGQLLLLDRPGGGLIVRLRFPI
ncbi:ATP-binding protein [Stenotrophomonas sp. LGBM10]|uniref:HAMP domain-containing sensor histidine kinase n=1 Tax=Stenotrophomonas sp. LGBM10 TaxID=3390038 RepID=UPI00398A8F1C